MQRWVTGVSKCPIECVWVANQCFHIPHSAWWDDLAPPSRVNPTLSPKFLWDKLCTTLCMISGRECVRQSVFVKVFKLALQILYICTYDYDHTKKNQFRLFWFWGCSFINNQKITRRYQIYIRVVVYFISCYFHHNMQMGISYYDLLHMRTRIENMASLNIWFILCMVSRPNLISHRGEQSFQYTHL